MHMFHRLVSRHGSGASWSPCGRKVVITDRTRLLHIIGGEVCCPHLTKFLDKLKRSGFVTEQCSIERTVLVHPYFVKDRADLLAHFTYRNEFCLAQDIHVPQGTNEPEDKMDGLKLELFDLGAKLSALRDDCLDLNLRIDDVFQDLRTARDRRD